MTKYLLEKTKDGSYWWEMEYTGTLFDGKEVYLINKYGGKHSHTYHIIDEICEVNNYRELDWAKCLLKPNSKYGYIDPNGTFFGCNLTDHLDFAKLVLNMNTPEEYGWIKIYKDSNGQRTFYSRRRFLTDAQINTLKEMELYDD